jgi:DNA-binding MarR family transcriptional regulator
MPLSTLSIRERMLDKMSDTSRIVDRLLAKGLVDKKTCATDKRLVDVYITCEGKKLLEKLDNKSDVMNSITSKLSNSELEKLNELLDLLRTFKGKKS